MRLDDDDVDWSHRSHLLHGDVFSLVAAAPNGTAAAMMALGGCDKFVVASRRFYIEV